MCVLVFFTTSSKKSHSKDNPAIYYYKCTYVFMYGARYSIYNLMDHEFYRQISKKILTYQI
jgi:hypothetical protein